MVSMRPAIRMPTTTNQLGERDSSRHPGLQTVRPRAPPSGRSVWTPGPRRLLHNRVSTGPPARRAFKTPIHKLRLTSCDSVPYGKCR